MNVSKSLNKKLSNFSLKSPIIFTFNIDWKIYQNFKLEQFNHVKKSFEKNNVKVELLPVITDHRTDIDSRVNQFSKEISRICDKYEDKAHLVAYSLGALHARLFISYLNGENYVKTLTTIGSPNQGCFVADLLTNENIKEFEFANFEPVLRSLGGHINWFVQEYNTNKLLEFKNTYIDSPSIKYFSIGGRREKIRCSESLRYINEKINEYNLDDPSNDGFIRTQEVTLGTHLINFDADHHELIGMRPKYNADNIFELMTNNIKYNDEDVDKLVNYA